MDLNKEVEIILNSRSKQFNRLGLKVLYTENVFIVQTVDGLELLRVSTQYGGRFRFIVDNKMSSKPLSMELGEKTESEFLKKLPMVLDKFLTDWENGGPEKARSLGIL